jgi:hypothetical protein
VSRGVAEAAATLLEDPLDRKLADSFFGVGSGPEQIAGLVAGACRQQLGVPPATCEFFEMSSGAVFGLALADGRRVMLKATRPRHGREQLEACAAVQSALATHGFPCPPVLSPVFPIGTLLAHFEAWVRPGRSRDAHDPPVREAMAGLLADLLMRLALFPVAGRVPFEPLAEDALWPEPHNALFDFEATKGGAEWIEEKARAALAVLRGSEEPPATGHLDWAVKHFRFDQDDRVVMVYDWDSLRRSTVPRIVGSAAVTFTASWDLPVVLTPSPGESLAFARVCEKARGKPFTSAQWRELSAGALHTLSYCARCEHALGGEDDWREDGFRHALQKSAGAGYFEV